ncbi:MAG: class I SAM-dependent methyltransferase [Spirulinaceae cyanobacterium]
MTDPITQLVYHTLQRGKGAFGLFHKVAMSGALNVIRPFSREPEPPAAAELAKLLERFEQLMDVDWQEAEQGIYPVQLLFDSPWWDFLQYYLPIVIDTSEAWDRRENRQNNVFAPHISTDRYPNYYLQNFHNQTDGYLSDQSAELYDHQVEILFSGGADPMRRRVLAPVKQAIATEDAPRILDVACGTGRTLRMIRGALPQAKLHGADLSAFYLRKANQLLSELPGALPQLMEANAEALPYTDNYFHALTCVFLFHELPGPVRQNIIAECFRVTQPGGILVICDSLQIQDVQELDNFLPIFPALCHEPYYRDYIQDNLVARLESVGFIEVQTQTHFMGKYWLAKKPG